MDGFYGVYFLTDMRFQTRHREVAVSHKTSNVWLLASPGVASPQTRTFFIAHLLDHLLVICVAQSLSQTNFVVMEFKSYQASSQATLGRDGLAML